MGLGISPGKVVEGYRRWKILNLCVEIIAFFKIWFERARVKKVLLSETCVVGDILMDLDWGFGDITGFTFCGICFSDSFLLLGEHIFIEYDPTIGIMNIVKLGPEDRAVSTR